MRETLKEKEVLDGSGWNMGKDAGVIFYDREP